MPGRRNDETIGSKCNGKDNGTGGKQPLHSPPSLPDWFHTCKSYKILEYDTARYPFRELVADWLEVPSDELEDLHETIPPAVEKASSHEQLVLHPAVRQAYISAKIEPTLSSTQRRTKKKDLYSSSHYHRFINTYRLFIKEVIVPLCRDEHDHSGRNEVFYQYPPTIRVVLPNGNRTITTHCDGDYRGHQQAEINYWLPATQVYGSNSLWLESAPNRGDFEPIELQYGQFLRFDGHDCRHYTLRNDTSSCRVSFDFRVVPSSLWSMEGKYCAMGDFCVESTNEQGYVAYWKTSRKRKNPMPCDISQRVQHSLSSVLS